MVTRQPTHGQVSVLVSVLTIDTTPCACYAVTMPRDLRIEYPGAIYPVLNRADQGGLSLHGPSFTYDIAVRVQPGELGSKSPKPETAP